MNTIKFIVVVSIALLSTDLVYHQIVNGQTEPATLQSCVIQGMGMLALITEKHTEINASDPVYKTYTFNMCNFYHKKTGTFPDLMSKEHAMNMLLWDDEFQQKYGKDMPQEFKDLRDK
jgi:hypothetical protein